MKQLVLGTAGHIDHGKTTLVKALTGVDTDRLKEEKKRGITIELGFAFLDLPSGQRLGIVDVPGHEKFVKNMVAGAAGIDLVAMIIAADEGVMPQTREHLDICKLLGVKTGLVALTKVDMVDEEWLELVQEDVREFVAGTFLEGKPMVPVSGVTGSGLDDLKQELDKLAGGLEERPAHGPFRLPVDRVFTMKGFGTVITGTAVQGSVATGEEVMIYPQKTTARVRGLEVHNQSTETARIGQRVAINLQGLEKTQVNRGDVLAKPGAMTPSLWIDVDLNVLSDVARPIKQRAPIRLHTGSAEIMGRVMLLDRDQAQAGESLLCQIRLESPVSVMTGDRFVIRSYSPVDTIAGGVVIHPHARRRKRNRPEIIADLKVLKSGDSLARIGVLARTAEEEGVALSEFGSLMNLPTKELGRAVQDMLSKKQLIRFDKEADRYLAGEVWQDLKKRTASLVGAFHEAQPLKPGMPKEELRQRLGGKKGFDPKLFNFLLTRLTKSGELAAEKDILRLAGHKVRLAEDDAKLREDILKAYSSGGKTPPKLAEVLEGRDAAQVKSLIGVLMNEGVLIKVKDDIIYHAPHLNAIKQSLIDFLTENQKITTPQFKELTGLSRKYMIPLLEYFDSSRVTMRIGEERVLRKS